MIGTSCSKYFPKKFVPSTTLDANGYSIYRRRDNGVAIQKGESFLDNTFVVPYNRQLLLKYNAHINVEWCNQSRSIKYLFIYINKGNDRVTATFYDSADVAVKEERVDEIRLFCDCRYLSPCEAVWRIFSFDINFRDVGVEILMFHLPGEQYVMYNKHQSLQTVVSSNSTQMTKFIAWFEANKKYSLGRNLKYIDFPNKFVWNKGKREWTPRKRGFGIGRMHYVPPGTDELFYMRTLLNHVTGPMCYEDLRTDCKDTHLTFRDACVSRGLLQDDKEYIDAIIEASSWGSGFFVRSLFTTLLIAHEMTRPEFVWENTWPYQTDDFLHRQQRLLQRNNEELQDLGLREIDILLHVYNKGLKDFPTMPQIYFTQPHEQNIRLILEELNYDRTPLAVECLQLLANMTTEQRLIFDTIVKRVQENKSGLFFINGFGGSGKTYLWRALAAYFRSRGDIVRTVASSEIASLLILGGRTTHLRFAIPIVVHEDSMCNIAHGSPIAKLIIRARLIIWDEAPMMHKHCFEAVDRTFRYILRGQLNCSSQLPFGGKVFVLGGAFRKNLPVIPKGTRPTIVNATINSSYLWNQCEVMVLRTNIRLMRGLLGGNVVTDKKFGEWILAVGDGKIGEVNDVDIQLPIPNDLIIRKEANPIETIVNSTYPNFLHSVLDLKYYQERAILAPTNAIVGTINDYMAQQIPGEERVYHSFDYIHLDHLQNDRNDNVHPEEFVNTISSSGLPKHKLSLKVGVPIMLLRNVDQIAGLCNGTRLIITCLGKFVLEAKVISGTNVGFKVYIP